MLALVVDWGLSLAISTAFFDGHPMATLAIFAASTAVLLTTLGHTIGHRLLGLGVARLADLRSSAEGGRTAPGTPQAAIRRAPGLVPALLRTVLLCLVIPAAIWDGEGRGMHDVAAGTVILRR